MIMPFPGMDPYLEHALLWPEVHMRLMVNLADQLRPLLRPRYVVSLEYRLYLIEPEQTPDQRIPDLLVQRARKNGTGAVATLPVPSEPVIVAVPEPEVREEERREAYLEIQDRYRNFKPVTSVEVLSPANKGTVEGQQSYRLKQRQVLNSECHLVEIDLLRRGRHILCVPEQAARNHGPYDYLACVSRYPDERRRFELYPAKMRQRLPVLRVPLTDPDPDAPLDLQAALEQVYEHGDFVLKVRYDEPCDPPLEPADQEWASACWQTYKAARQDLFGVPAPVSQS